MGTLAMWFKGLVALASLLGDPAGPDGRPAGTSISNVTTVDLRVAGVNHRMTAGNISSVAREEAPVVATTRRDGVRPDRVDHAVMGEAPSVTRTSRIVSDPFHGTTNPVLMRGAVMEVCVTVTNAAGSPTASGVDVTDTLPAGTTFQTSFGILIDGTITNGACNANGSAGGSHHSGIVNAALSDIAPGEARTVLFRATVN